MGRKVALDFAVINSLGQSHWQQTYQDPGAAELAYTALKCSHNGTAEKRAAAGLHFQPMVMSVQGGMTPAMGAIVYSIAGAVATVEGEDADAIRLDCFQRLAIVVDDCRKKWVQRYMQKRSAIRKSIITHEANSSAEVVSRVLKQKTEKYTLPRSFCGPILGTFFGPQNWNILQGR